MDDRWKCQDGSQMSGSPLSQSGASAKEITRREKRDGISVPVLLIFRLDLNPSIPPPSSRSEREGVLGQDIQGSVCECETVER